MAAVCKYHQPDLDITKTHTSYENNGHDYSNMAQSRILFYMHQWQVVPDHGTKCEENPSTHHRGMCEDG